MNDEQDARLRRVRSGWKRGRGMAMGEEKGGGTVYGYIFSSHNKMTFEAEFISWLVKWRKRTKRKKKTNRSNAKKTDFVLFSCYVPL